MMMNSIGILFFIVKQQSMDAIKPNQKSFGSSSHFCSLGIVVLMYRKLQNASGSRNCTERPENSQFWNLF